MERLSFQRCPAINPNPGLWEYKVKTGRSYPNTKEEWIVYKTWQVENTYDWLQTETGWIKQKVICEETDEEEEGTVCWESWHPACSCEDDEP